jgi:LCP family protein required for cell wall assembly
MKKKSTAVTIIWAVAILLFAGSIVYAFVFSGSGTDSDREKEGTEEPVGEAKNFLVLGLDARRGGTGRTDTIMVVNADPKTGKIHLLSIPRDTRVLIKGAYDRINAAYVYGGVDLAKEAVEDLLDIKIDHHVIIHFQGFIEVVDLLGGVEVNVPVRMYRPSENIDLQPGEQVLDGEDALAFARYRNTSGGDLDRAQHQQEILEALRKKVFSPGTIVKIPELIGIATEYIDTDMTRTEMLEMAAHAEKFKEQELVSGTLPGENVKIDGLWYYSAYEEKIPEIALPFKKDPVE